jgi:hypothetical protein
MMNLSLLRLTLIYSFVALPTSHARIVTVGGNASGFSHESTQSSGQLSDAWVLPHADYFENSSIFHSSFDVGWTEAFGSVRLAASGTFIGDAAGGSSAAAGITFVADQDGTLTVNYLTSLVATDSMMGDTGPPNTLRHITAYAANLEPTALDFPKEPGVQEGTLTFPLKAGILYELGMSIAGAPCYPCYYQAEESYALIGAMSWTIVASPLPADFDGDGGVNGVDLDIWRSSFGQNAGGDADHDVDSDGADFLTWQRQVEGSSPAVSALVPEPKTSLLILPFIGAVFESSVRTMSRCFGTPCRD